MSMCSPVTIEIGPRGRLVRPLRRVEQILVIVGPWLVVVVHGRHVRVVEDVDDGLRLAGGLQLAACHRPTLPAAVVLLLVLPGRGDSRCRAWFPRCSTTCTRCPCGPSRCSCRRCCTCGTRCTCPGGTPSRSCERTFIAVPSSYHFRSGSLRTSTCVSRLHAGRAPVIEMVSELPVAAHHQVGFQPHAGQAVVPAGAPVIAQRRFRARSKCAPASGTGCRCRAGCARSPRRASPPRRCRCGPPPSRCPRCPISAASRSFIQNGSTPRESVVMRWLSP